jgi:hypothetical protein
MRRTVFATLLLWTVLVPHGASAQTWLFDSAHTLPSTDTGWGGISLEPGDPTHPTRLFIARRDDGLLAWDPHTARGVTIDDSKGANAVIFAPPTGRAYAPMTDGSVLAFDMQSGKPFGRSDLGLGALQTGFWEPTQNRVYMITATGPEKGPGADRTTWVSIDAASGQVLGKTVFNSRTMDTPAVDGQGAIYAPMRDKALLQKLSAKDLSLEKTWKLGDCQQPTAVLWDGAADRVLIACRGDKPVFVALNPATGIVATIPIGRGVDGMVMDEDRHLLITSNGQDGTMTVIRQDAADTYALVETITTRPMARGVALDHTTGALFTAAATVTLPAPPAPSTPASAPTSGADATPTLPFYHPNSFTITAFKAAGAKPHDH